jgi:hypothetical protein
MVSLRKTGSGQEARLDAGFCVGPDCAVCCRPGSTTQKPVPDTIRFTVARWGRCQQAACIPSGVKHEPHTSSVVACSERARCGALGCAANTSSLSIRPTVDTVTCGGQDGAHKQVSRWGMHVHMRRSGQAITSHIRSGQAAATPQPCVLLLLSLLLQGESLIFHAACPD